MATLIRSKKVPRQPEASRTLVPLVGAQEAVDQRERRVRLGTSRMGRVLINEPRWRPFPARKSVLSEGKGTKESGPMGVSVLRPVHPTPASPEGSRGLPSVNRDRHTQLAVTIGQ